MAGQLDLFGAPRADAEERPAAPEGGAQVAPPAPAVAPAAPERVWVRADDTPKARAKRKRDFARWLKERGIRLGSDDDTDARYGG